MLIRDRDIRTRTTLDRKQRIFSRHCTKKARSAEAKGKKRTGEKIKTGMVHEKTKNESALDEQKNRSDGKNPMGKLIQRSLTEVQKPRNDSEE